MYILVNYSLRLLYAIDLSNTTRTRHNRHTEVIDLTGDDDPMTMTFRHQAQTSQGGAVTETSHQPPPINLWLVLDVFR